jgi:hypothetical protein
MKILQVLVLLFLLNFIANAQDKSAILTGNVYDNYGSLIVNATIKFKDSNKKEFECKSDRFGEYRIVLPIGTYSIKFEAKGFQTFQVKKYKIVEMSDSKTSLHFDVILDLPHYKHRS